ncbi:MAG: hypothetical protein OEY32_02415 [Candidatus Krumholzibacteria bacterium]|nr:hypothetical protein [Candidatus Krumholzibacteria bacterium]
MQLMLNCLWMTRAEELLRGAEELAPADMTNARTRAAGHNQRAMAAIVAEFTVARENLLARLDAATDDDVTRASSGPCAWSTCASSWPNTTIITWRLLPARCAPRATEAA